VKRIDFVKHLHTHGCRFIREGGNHTLFANPTTKKKSTVPRHRELNHFDPKNLP
jgi:predicted RNA binding protein YcfA (HicA-like mRNA interferase family)